MNHAQVKCILMEKGWEEDEAEREADDLASHWYDEQKDFELEEKYRDDTRRKD